MLSSHLTNCLALEQMNYIELLVWSCDHNLGQSGPDTIVLTHLTFPFVVYLSHPIHLFILWFSQQHGLCAVLALNPSLYIMVVYCLYSADFVGFSLSAGISLISKQNYS